MPVLEAMACGLPVVVTAGGPTDEFVPDDAGWRIAVDPLLPAAPGCVADWPTIEPIWMLEPDVDHLARILREVDADAGERARRAAAAQRGRAGLRLGRRSPTPTPPGSPPCAPARRAPRPSRSQPLELPDARGLNLLATPAWGGEDRLAELLAAYAAAFGPDDDVALYLLADPDLDGDAERWEAPRARRPSTPPASTWRRSPTSRSSTTPAPPSSARVHAAVDAYVPLHAGCGGHVAARPGGRRGRARARPATRCAGCAGLGTPRDAPHDYRTRSSRAIPLPMDLQMTTRRETTWL